MDNNYDNTPGNDNEVKPQQDITGQEAAGQETAAQKPSDQEAAGRQPTGQESTEQASGSESADTQQSYTYTDPNADYVQYQTGQQNQYGAGDDRQNSYGTQGGYGSYSSQDYQYGGENNQNSQYRGSNNQEFNYQDNYNYNVGNNTGYSKPYNNGMDESPMSLGDWVLTILIMTLVPCVGIVLYFVWAFSKNGNVNRRNYCRAYLIITGIALVLVIIFMIVFGIAGLGLSGLYY